LGQPDHIDVAITPAPTGVDEQCSILFRYNSGAMAQLFSTLSANLPTEADICGTEGRIKLTSGFYEPSSIIEFYKGRTTEKQIIPVEKEGGFGYQYEARHVNECLRNSLTESNIVSFANTISMMETLDKVRHLAGVRYPADDTFN
jgi:predicted dehydrogenase